MLPSKPIAIPFLLSKNRSASHGRGSLEGLNQVGDPLIYKWTISLVLRPNTKDSNMIMEYTTHTQCACTDNGSVHTAQIYKYETFFLFNTCLNSDPLKASI